MAGFAQGFSNGFQMMEGHINRERKHDRLNRLDKKNDARYQDQIEYRDDRDAVTDERYNSQREYRRNRDTKLDTRYEQQQAENSRRWNQGFGLKQEAAERSEESHKLDKQAKEMAIEQSDMQIKQQRMESLLKDLSAGASLDDKGVKVLKDASFPMDLLAGDQYQNAKQTFAGVMQGDIDYNAPEVHGLMTTVLGDRIKQRSDGKARDGSKITGMKIARIVPLDGGRVAFDMEISTEKGNVYHAPLTENGTAKDDDLVRGIPVGDLMDTFDNAVQLSEYAKRNPKLVYAVKDYMNKTGRGQRGDYNPQQKAQISYLENQISELSDLIGADMTPEEDRRKYKEEMGQYQARLESLIGLQGQGGARQQPASAPGNDSARRPEQMSDKQKEVLINQVMEKAGIDRETAIISLANDYRTKKYFQDYLSN